VRTVCARAPMLTLVLDPRVSPVGSATRCWVGEPHWGSVAAARSFQAVYASVSAAGLWGSWPRRIGVNRAWRARTICLVGKVVARACRVCRPAGRRSLPHSAAEARVKRPEHPQAHGSPGGWSCEGCRLTRGARLSYQAGRSVALRRPRRPRYRSRPGRFPPASLLPDEPRSGEPPLWLRTTRRHAMRSPSLVDTLRSATPRPSTTPNSERAPQQSGQGIGNPNGRGVS
jgi:hypothetical protein